MKRGGKKRNHKPRILFGGLEFDFKFYIAHRLNLLK